MRISVRKDDPGYNINAHNYDVFLNGVQIDLCFTADEETGEAFCYDSDSNGIVYNNGKELCTVLRKGKIKIIKSE